MAQSKPSITGTAHTLPFDKLSSRDFERLCLWLVEREGYERAEHLGAAGSEQGRDIVAWRADRLWAFQCKRVRSFGPRDALAEIEKVLALAQDQRPAGLVFLVTCDVSANTRQQVRERCGKELECRFWGGTELDAEVKRHEDIVEEFFRGPTYESKGTVDSAKKIVESMVALFTSYFETLVGILVSPTSTFLALFESRESGNTEIGARPIIFAGLSLSLGMLLGAGLSIRGAPPNASLVTIAITIVPYLFLWLLYGIGIHFVARLFGGAGKPGETIGGIFYILGTLHPVLLVLIYALTPIFPDALGYQHAVGEVGVQPFLFRTVLGVRLALLYLVVSFVFAAVYLSFPLKIIHRLSLPRLLLLYAVGLAALVVFAIVSAGGLEILWYFW